METPNLDRELDLKQQWTPERARCAAELDALQAENAKLREAAQELLDHASDVDYSIYKVTVDISYTQKLAALLAVEKESK